MEKSSSVISDEGNEGMTTGGKSDVRGGAKREGEKKGGSFLFFFSGRWK